MFQSYGRITIFLHDVLMIPLAWYLAYWLRFNLDTIPEEFVRTATLVLPVVIICQSISYIVFGLYRGIWRFASLPDLVRIGKAILLGILIITLAVFLITRMEAVPRTIIPLYAIFIIRLARWEQGYLSIPERSPCGNQQWQAGSGDRRR